MTKPLNPKIKKRGRPLGSRNDVTTVDGVIRAINKIIRSVEKGRMEHKAGRSLTWMYAQLRDTLALGILEKRIEKLEGAYDLDEIPRGEETFRQLHS